MNLLRIPSRRRAAAGAAVALAGLAAATSPALAAPIADGTSNTIQFAVASAELDQAHHRVLVTAPAQRRLTAGTRLATAEVVTPRSAFILSNVLVESLAPGASASLALNFTAININAFERKQCVAGIDACLIEEDGTYPPAP